MSNVKELRQAYREIKAPPFLVARVSAELADQPVRLPRLAPSLAVAVLAVLCLWMFLPGEIQRGKHGAAPSPAFSIARLPEMIPEPPAAPLPSLARVRSPFQLTMPPKPVVGPPTVRPPDSLLKLSIQTENHHA